jgi:hypothetical protein
MGINPIKPLIDKVRAFYKLAKATISLIGGGEGTTQSEQEINNVSTAVGAIFGVATLLGVASG